MSTYSILPPLWADNHEHGPEDFYIKGPDGTGLGLPFSDPFSSCNGEGDVSDADFLNRVGGGYGFDMGRGSELKVGNGGGMRR